ncbi:NADP-dependent oxidoreductase domain-containing protein 1 isoform X2 [Grammomys surdaster]|uniref:NADP-dependent oxidoreductase domain-containing protein 1 isoform X2 n=1 Tax=Grammomys surdaster TaxID=491861 RepID=UPI0010A0973B|nr:NADP-dependent oxidoreductase domain-containing protein 1 isoform X2 [Grammomys surdaster]
MEVDMLEDLESLKFEYGIPEEERYWLYLQGRYRGLMIKGCAHAAFFCKMFSALSELLQELPRTIHPRTVSFDAAATEDEKLTVGIIGCGHLGKQLANVLLKIVPIPAENLQISTRRPDSLGEDQLKSLLNHTNIMRPQYQFVEDFDNIWGENEEVPAALQDSVMIRSTCPYNNLGGVILNVKWLEGLCYALINVCSARSVFHSQVLKLLNKLLLSVHLESCKTDATSCPRFQLTDFMNKSYVRNLYHKRPFPWFDLTTVQLKETPFSQHISATRSLQDHITLLYCESFGLTISEEELPYVSTVIQPLENDE